MQFIHTCGNQGLFFSILKETGPNKQQFTTISIDSNIKNY